MPTRDSATSTHPAHSASQPGVFSRAGVCSPHPRLLTHYLIISLLTGPGFLIMFPVLYFRYHTLSYRFDADGVTMKVGILFKQEIALTYRRIQDIHVNRGIIQRWLGLATVACQTASGGSGPELVIEGLMDYEKVRDFLYQQMRGAKGDHSVAAADSLSPAHAPSQSPDQALALLTDIRDRLVILTAQVQSQRSAHGSSSAPKEPPNV